MKKIDIRNLFKYSEAGVHPQPTPDEWKIKKLIWNLRIDASILMGITEEEIIKKASHEIKCNSIAQIGCGSLGTSRWDNIEDWRRHSYVSKLLPSFDILYDRFDRFKIIISDSDEFKLAKKNLKYNHMKTKEQKIAEFLETPLQVGQYVNHSCIKGTFLDELNVNEGRKNKIILPNCSNFCEIEFADIPDQSLNDIMSGYVSIYDVVNNKN